MKALQDDDLQSVSGGNETVPEGLQSAMEMLLRWNTEASAHSVASAHGTACLPYKTALRPEEEYPFTERANQ